MHPRVVKGPRRMSPGWAYWNPLDENIKFRVLSGFQYADTHIDSVTNHNENIKFSVLWFVTVSM
jgi:hypothetical protein